MKAGTVYGGYYGAKSYESVRKEENRTYAGFAGKAAEKEGFSQKDMTLDEYKAYFNEKMNSLYTHPSQRNMNNIIDITDAAYKRMQTDPEYEKKILDALAQNKAVNFGGNIPVTAYMHIDDTWEKCSGYTQGMKENTGYSGSSSTKRADAGRKKKAGQKELLEEYLEQQAQARRKQKELLDEKAAKAVQEQSRLSKAWSSKQQLSESEEMELFKKEFYEDLSRITIHKTLNNVAVNISEAGFRAMKEDPEYREKILSLLKRDLGSSLAPRNCSAVFTVGAAINEYRGDSWPVGYDEEFYARSKDSFFKKTSEKKDRQKELMEKYLEKRARTKKLQQEMRNEKIAKMNQEQSRLAKLWTGKRQMAKASNAYDANVMTETAAGGDLLPG